MTPVRAGNFRFPLYLHHRRPRHKTCSTFIWTDVGLATYRACHSGMTAILTTNALCRHVSTHNTMCNLLHNSVLHLFAPPWRMSFVCESKKSEIKACLYRCTMWKEHPWIFSGTVEQLCLVTFQSAITELQQSANLCDLKTKCCGAKPRMRASAQCVTVLKNMPAFYCRVLLIA